MRETYFYYEFSQKELDERDEQSRIAQGGVSIAFEEPAAYEGEVLEYDDGGADGSRTISPTPFGTEPTDAGFIDVPMVVAVASDDGTTAVGAEAATLRVEQHPSIYGTPVRLVMRCVLSNGSTPNESSIISSVPINLNGAVHIEMAMNLTPSSVITQQALLDAISSLTYAGQYILIPSIASDSTAPIVAFKSLENYTSAGIQFQDLCTDIFTLQTTAGNPDAQIASGLPHIEGTFEQGRLLTVNLIDITDRDTDFNYAYQWYREELISGVHQNVAITSGGNSSFYIVSSADVGKNLTVAISYVNNAGEATQKNSPPVFIANSRSTGEITLTAEAYRAGNIVQAEVGDITDRNTVQSLSNYRWQRSIVIPYNPQSAYTVTWTDIENSSDTNYLITAADEGRRLRFSVDVTDSLGDVVTLTSEQSDVVNRPPVGTIEFLGDATVGSYLTASVDFVEPDSINFTQVYNVTTVWYRNGIEIPNSTTTGITYFNTSLSQYPVRHYYQVQSEDYGKQISAVMSYTDGRQNPETVESPTISIGSSTPTGLAISGVNEVSGTLAPNFSSFYDSDLQTVRYYTDSNGDTQTARIGKPILTDVLYRWQLDGGAYLTPEGNQYDSLVVSGSYYGQTIVLSVKYPDEFNSGVYKTTTASKQIVNSDPTGEIVLTGSTIGVGNPITLNVDQVNDINGPYGTQENSGWTFNYSLDVRQRDEFGNLQPSTNITSGVMTGANTISYTVASQYQNSIITATVTYDDREGVQHTLTDSVSIPAVGYPTIDGTLEQSETVSINVSQVENLFSIGTIKWYRYDGSAFNEITGQNGTDLVLSLDDVGNYIKVELTYTNNNSELETRTSEPVLVQNSTPVGKPRIANSGSTPTQGFSIGDVLSASVDHIADQNGIQEFYDYQWYRQTVQHSYSATQENMVSITAIADATNATYTIQSDDQAKRIGYTVKLRDQANQVHTLNSGLSWRRVDYTPTGFIRVKRATDDNLSEAGINELVRVDWSQFGDLDGRTSINYKWYVDGNLVLQGVGQYEYLTKTEDYNKQIMVTVDYKDQANGDPKGPFTSTNVFTVSDTPASGLYLQGTALPGNTLTGDLRFLSDPDGVAPEQYMTFQWYRDNLPISGENTKFYTVVRSDYGSTLKLRLNYTDGQGNAEQIEASVLVGESTATGGITDDGFRLYGTTVTFSVDTISDVYGPETVEERNQTQFTYGIVRKTGHGDVAVSSGTIFGNETFSYTWSDDDFDPYGRSNRLEVTVEFLNGNGTQKQKIANYWMSIPANGDDIIVPPGDGWTLPEFAGQLYNGPLEAQGSGYKTVELSSTTNLIVYDTEGKNPDTSSFTLTATPRFHVDPVYYRFYLLADSGDIEIPKDVNDYDNTRQVVTSEENPGQLSFRVDTYEGSLETTIIAADVITIYSIEE